MSLPASLTLALVCAATALVTRPVPDWPYERLMRESDIVVVAEPVAVKNVDYDFPEDKSIGPLLRDSNPKIASMFQKLAAKVTSFRVIGTIKGERRKSVDVLHFYWTERVPVENGPMFVDFTASRKISMTTKDELTNSEWQGESKPQFLLFLKIADGIHSINGRYEPVSGQWDPGLSVRLMIEP